MAVALLSLESFQIRTHYPWITRKRTRGKHVSTRRSSKKRNLMLHAATATGESLNSARWSFTEALRRNRNHHLRSRHILITARSRTQIFFRLWMELWACNYGLLLAKKMTVQQQLRCGIISATAAQFITERYFNLFRCSKLFEGRTALVLRWLCWQFAYVEHLSVILHGVLCKCKMDEFS